MLFCILTWLSLFQNVHHAKLCYAKPQWPTHCIYWAVWIEVSVVYWSSDIQLPCVSKLVLNDTTSVPISLPFSDMCCLTFTLPGIKRIFISAHLMPYLCIWRTLNWLRSAVYLSVIVLHPILKTSLASIGKLMCPCVILYCFYFLWLSYCKDFSADLGG